MGLCGSKETDTVKVPQQLDSVTPNVSDKSASGERSISIQLDAPFVDNIDPADMPFSPTFQRGSLRSNSDGILNADNVEESNSAKMKKQFNFNSPEASRKPATASSSSDCCCSRGDSDTDKRINSAGKVNDAAVSASEVDSPSASPSPSPSPSVSAPPILQSFINKQGHIVKNWKNRYFVLADGVLKYFELPDSSPPFGINLKGELTHLDKYSVTEDEADIPADKWKNCDKDAFYIYLYSSSDRGGSGYSNSEEEYPNMLLQFDNAQRMTTWYAALKSHIAFKRQQQHQQQHQ